MEQDACAIASEDPSWGGSWAILQEPAFAALFARHLRAERVAVGCASAVVSRKPFVGRLHGLVGNPEARGAFEAWGPALLALRLGRARVLTNRRVPSFERWRTSRDDECAFLVELARDEQTLWQAMESRCRRAVRRAQRAGVVVRAAANEAEVDAAHRIVRATSGDGRLFDVPSLALLREARAQGFCELLVALHDDRVVAGVFLLPGASVLGWAGGSDPAAPVPPSALLYWEAIRWSRAGGHRWFDFGVQSPSGAPSLALFKRGFTPVLRSAYVYDVPGPAWKRALLAARDTFRSRLGR